MAVVKYPHMVKVDGAYYAAHEPIEVADALEHIKMGAVAVEEEVTVERLEEASNEKLNRKAKKAKAE